MAEPSRTQQTDGRTLLIWVLVLASVLALALLQPLFPDIKAYPVAWTLPVTDWLNIGMDWFVGGFDKFNELGNYSAYVFSLSNYRIDCISLSEC